MTRVHNIVSRRVKGLEEEKERWGDGEGGWGEVGGRGVGGIGGKRDLKKRKQEVGKCEGKGGNEGRRKKCIWEKEQMNLKET